MFFITDHDYLFSVFVHIKAAKNILNDFCFISSATIHLTSANFCEILGKPEMIQNLSYI